MIALLYSILLVAGGSAVLAGGECPSFVGQQFAAGDGAISVALGDLDGDGDADLVVVNYNGHNVSVIKNNGNGTFAAAVNYPAAYTPASVALGDLDGDGDADVVVANDVYNDVSVFMNNGNGTLAASVNYAAGSRAYSVALGDLDGDGDADMAVANGGSDNVSVLMNNGNGTFASAANYAAGNFPISVALGDLDNDGDADMAVANYQSNFVTVRKNNGNGTFAAATSNTWGQGAYSVVMGDLDGDGDADLAAAVANNDNVAVLKNNGNGTFAAALGYAVGGGEPRSVAAGDLDGDGDADMVVAIYDSDNVSVLLNNGNGTFAAAVDYPAGNGPASVALSDLDDDGDADLAVANYFGGDVSVLLNNCLVLACGQPGAGSCFVAHSGPGCDDLICCEAVCAVDPFCCETQWNGICVGEAKGVCAIIPQCTNPVETIVLRSGQVDGAPGQPNEQDTSIRYWKPTYSKTCQFGTIGPFSYPSDFLDACTGLHPFVIDDQYSQWPPLLCDADAGARWINWTDHPTAGGSMGDESSVLYCCDFTIVSPCIDHAEITFCWAVDDYLGDTGSTPPNPEPAGVYLGHGAVVIPMPAIAGSSAGTGSVTVAIPAGTLAPGVNHLWVYQRNDVCGLSGVIFRADISICPCDCPCNNTCLPGDVVENEPCGMELNEGCGAAPAVFEAINCNASVCGTFWVVGGSKDQDVYSFTVVEPSIVTWEVCADVSVDTWLSNCTCSSAIIHAFGTGACPTVASAQLCPGTYCAFVRPTQFDGLPCAQKYRATLTCTPLPPDQPFDIPCCGNAQTGSCYVARSTPYCNEKSCCEYVCYVDAYCCTDKWDTACVQAALMSGECSGGSLHCENGPPIVYHCEVGCRDEFDTTDGPEHASGESDFGGPGCVAFDVIPTNGCFQHTFKGCWPSCPAVSGPNFCGTIVGAYLEIRVNEGPAGGWDDLPDGIFFRDQGSIVAAVGGFPALATITLDLANLPGLNGGNILSTLYDGELGVTVGDDTGVDYLALTVIHCRCERPFNPQFERDEPGNFNTPSPTTPSAALEDAVEPPTCPLIGYDVSDDNSCFIETINLAPYTCISGGHLEIGVVPTNNDLQSNDALYLELRGEFQCDSPGAVFGGEPFAWSMSLTDLQMAGKISGILTPGTLSVIQLDLDELPPDANGVRNIVGHLLDGSLDIQVADDTGVSFINFFPVVCECPPSPGDCCDDGMIIDPACAALVCSIDPWCCEVGCDSICVAHAKKLCECQEAPGCSGDLDGDGSVDGADLGTLLGAWGTPGPVGDVSGDGIVDGADLGLLLGAWGPC